MIKLSANTKSPKCMKDIFTEALLEFGAEDERVVVLDADLAKPSGSAAFGAQYPNRFFDCGIMEANMAGCAAGLSDIGLIPFMHTFAAFASRKCADQIFQTMCYPKANVKIIGTDPGVTAALNGGSHMGMEDMGILMGFQNITLLEPADNVALKALLKAVKDEWGVHYLRMYRRDNDSVYEEGSEFAIGKANLLRDGADVTIIASGIEVREALTAAEQLAEKGLSARVVDMFTWKPLDEDMIVESAEKTGAIVVAENHSLNNGLGSAVAQALARKRPVPAEFVGITEFGVVGNLDYLLPRFRLTANDIVSAAQRAVERKG